MVQGQHPPARPCNDPRQDALVDESGSGKIRVRNASGNVLRTADGTRSMSTAIRYLAPEPKRLIMAGQEPAWLTKHPRASYVRSGYLSVPPWIDRAEMRWIHWCKCAWSIATGVEHVLDHIVPLNHPRV